MAAIFFTGQLNTTTGKITCPSIVNTTSGGSATNPPYTINYSNGQPGFNQYNEYAANPWSYQLTNGDSPLVIMKNQVYQGDWATARGTYSNHDIITFSNGCSIKACNSGSGLYIRFYTSDNLLYYEANLPTQGVNPSFQMVSIFEDNTTGNIFPALIQYTGFGSAETDFTKLMIPQRDVYFLDNAIAPVYHWSPFEHLTGNDGQFQMDLSQISADVIGDGETQTGDSDASHFTISPRSSLYNMSVNMLDGQEYTIAYCGDNYLTCTKRTEVGTQSTIIHLTLKFYFRSDTLIYTCPEISITRTGTTTPNDYYLSIIYDATNNVAAPDLINEINILGSNVYYYNNFSLPSETQLSALYIWLQDNGNAQSNDPYGTGTTDNGGDPQGTRLQDHITSSPLPTCGGLDIGLVTLYRPTSTQLGQIAAFLWSDNVLDNFKKYFNNFADNILCCYSLPFTPSALPSKAFTVGNMTSEITGVEYCTVRTFDIDMGSVEVSNRWGSYLDYSPYTKLEIYLPYLGIHSLDIDEIMSPARMDGSMPDRQGTVLSLVYRLDILTGIIVAMIKVRVYTKTGGYTDEIRYQFSGKVGYTIPLTGQTFSNLVNAVITAGAGLATTIATGGLTAPMTAGATVTATIQAQKPSIERVGNISGDASMLATNVPYICISVPNKPYMDEQQKFTGFPSYKTGLLSEFSGYTEVLEAHIEGISCTDEEREKILTYLKGGVIL